MDALDWMRWYGPAPREVRIIKPDGYVYGLRWTEGEQGARVLERAAAANADGCGIYYQSGEAGERWTGKAGTVVNGDIERRALCLLRLRPAEGCGERRGAGAVARGVASAGCVRADGHRG